MTDRPTFLCFAHGSDQGWEAICVDLDIAVQGDSFDDVRNGLNHAVETFVEDAAAESDEDRASLLSRRAPWHVIAGLTFKLILANAKRRRARDMQATFPVYATPKMHISAVPG